MSSKRTADCLDSVRDGKRTEQRLPQKEQACVEGEEGWGDSSTALGVLGWPVVDSAACEDEGNPGNDNLLTGGSLVVIVIIIVVIVFLVRRRRG